MKRVREAHRPAQGIRKCPTGIQGLDEVTGGGLPAGRPTLVCGGAGCGKTLLAMEFLVRGVTQFNEPGVFMSFEETGQELAANVKSLGFDLKQMEADGRIALDYVRVERSEIEETGEYDLEGLFVRLEYAVNSVKARRVVLDTIESLFAGLSNPGILRAELRRLFRWLKDRKLTAIITGERGDGTLTRQGLEEYVSDCVILLDHRIHEQVSTRRLRVVKYRGSTHGTNEYPFLIDEDGITVMPITSLGLTHQVSTDRISSGVDRLDAMLGGEGLFRGSSVLVSGTAGTGKTTIAAGMVDAACRRGEKCLYFAFEESPAQLIRNMRSVAIDLEPHLRSRRLEIHASRPSFHGLEMHLASIHKRIERAAPAVVVVDPLSNLTGVGTGVEVSAALLRLVDYFKGRGVTALFTSLTRGGSPAEQADSGVSSLMDTWLLLRDVDSNGERNRLLHILKSRGMAHSKQVREFLLTDKGVMLRDVYVGSGGVLLGSARASQEAKERADAVERHQEIERRQFELEQKRRAAESEVALIRAKFAQQEAEIRRLIGQEEARERQVDADRRTMGALRQADAVPHPNGPRKCRRGA